MALGKGKAKGKAKRPAVKRRGRGRKRNSNVSEYASCSVKETIVPQGQPAFVVNTMYDLHNVTLATYDRAVQIAQGYQFFRMKKIKLTMKIGYDTYQAGAGAATRPNLYYMIDKSQSIPVNVSLESLKQMGARPRRCDEKPTSIQWAPAVLTADNTIAGPSPAQYKISPWLNTNAQNLGAFVPSAVQHNGLFWYVQMDSTGGVGYNYSVEVEVQFEFKKPLWTQTLSATPSRGVTSAPKDDSPDGLVGGADVVIIPSF